MKCKICRELTPDLCEGLSPKERKECLEIISEFRQKIDRERMLFVIFSISVFTASVISLFFKRKKS